MSTEVRRARDLTRSLTARAARNDPSVDDDELAVLNACERAFVELSRSLGAPGFGTLLRRAKVITERTHPLLGGMHLGVRVPYLGGVPDLVQLHGGPAVIEGLEAILDTIFSMLGGLIGIDMVIRLVERDPPLESTLVEDPK